MTGNYTIIEIYLISLSVLETLKSEDGKKPFMYLMEYPYDAQKPLNYFLTQLFNGVTGFSCVSLMIAEGEFMCHPLIYLEARYQELHRKLHDLFTYSQFASKKSMKPLATVFRENLKDIIRRQQTIDEFNKLAGDFLSPKIFMSFTFGTMLLCCISFQLAAVSIFTEIMKDCKAYFV